MSSVPINAISSQEMQRLAFIRLLVQQGVEQAARPEPIAAAAILTFHAVELFLMLTSEHVRVQAVEVPGHEAAFVRHGDTEKRGGVLERVSVVGESLDSESVPSGAAVVQARDDTERFFEENTPKVFNIPFDSIDMVELIPQPSTREQTRSARRAWQQEDHLTAMGTLALAFEELFTTHVMNPDHGYSSFAFGPAVEHGAFMGRDIARAVTAANGERTHRNPTHAVDKAGKQFQQLSSTVFEMQAALRVMTLGLDLHRYFRFKALCPDVDKYADQRVKFYDAGGRFQADEDGFAYCEQFVLAAALRLAELEGHTIPTWRNAR
ncbi:hypothetical protein [Streptomyces sp. NPDC058011]|uniref:hypothetical protein n=1 Tax=Streptomyces sp. NPDC058011 TaxID=3346305 RepID=UPI0036E4619E